MITPGKSNSLNSCFFVTLQKCIDYKHTIIDFVKLKSSSVICNLVVIANLLLVVFFNNVKVFRSKTVYIGTLLHWYVLLF